MAKAEDSKGVNKFDVEIPQDGGVAFEGGYSRRTNPHARGTEHWERWNRAWDTANVARGGWPLNSPKTSTAHLPPPVVQQIHGYKQQSPEATARGNKSKLLEATVLDTIDELHLSLQNEFGDLAKLVADYQSEGFKHDDVDTQRAKLAGFKATELELNGVGRWLALGKTSIETGFMQVNRSIFRPARVKVPE